MRFSSLDQPVVERSARECQIDLDAKT